MRNHLCLDNELSDAPSWFEYDYQGIPLCSVCERCRAQKLSRYRPEILEGYSQDDVDEDIEPERDVG